MIIGFMLFGFFSFFLILFKDLKVLFFVLVVLKKERKKKDIY